MSHLNVNLPNPDIELYPHDLAEMVDQLEAKACAAHEWLESQLANADQIALRMVATREAILTSLDRERVLGYLTTDFFDNESGDRRVASFLVALDIEAAAARRLLELRCEPYQIGQPLFAGRTQLLERVRESELVPVDCISSIDDDGVVEVDGVFARLDPMLPPGIVRFLRQRCPSAPLYVRLDPTIAWNARPLQHLVETVLSPADPNWWKNLALHPRTSTGGTYSLEAPEKPCDNIEAFWEYHIEGFRRVETSASRRTPDYLTIMLEELEESGSLLMGRCVHMDTTAVKGTSPADARLQHADLALNVYQADAIERRLGDQLRDGIVADASFRTHLLRLEDAPVELVLPLTVLFFRSRSLLRDLISNQFRPNGL